MSVGDTGILWWGCSPVDDNAAGCSPTDPYSIMGGERTHLVMRTALLRQPLFDSSRTGLDRILLATAFVLCLSHVSAVHGAAKSTAKKAHAAPTSLRTDSLSQRDTVPPALTIPKWTGHDFIAIRKNAMFEKFGYEVYPSAKLATASGPVDAAVQLPNRRVKTAVLAQQVLTAKSVTRQTGGEFLVEFSLKSNGTPLFARTRDGAIEGLACAEDLTTARSRWLGKTVFSARRSIDTYDSSTGSFGTFKVSVGAPLTVTDVAWGRTPLPPKPVWLLVECADKRRGFIPTNYSYTNVLAGKRFARLPWESEILEQNPREANKWDEAIWEMIDSHNVAAGMSTAQVRLAWGEPRSMEQDSAASTIRWVYEAQTLTFVRDSLLAE